MGRSKVKGKVTGKALPNNFFTVFKKDAVMLANDIGEQFAKAAVKEVKRVIRKQAYNWKPLNESYKKSKKRRGLDTRIYMATRDYVNKGIKWWKQGGAVFMGPTDDTHEPSGLTYKHLARIHEYGTDHIPARPLWRPILSVMLRKRKGYAKAYKTAVKQAYKRRKRLQKL